MVSTKLYFRTTCVHIFFSLITAGLATSIVQNPSGGRISYQAWTTTQFLTFVGWGSFAISGVEVFLFLSGIWHYFIYQDNVKYYFIAHVVYMWTFNIFWLAAAASLANSIPGNCRSMSDCSRTKSLSALTWVTLVFFAAASCMLGYQWIFGAKLQIRPNGPTLPTTNPSTNSTGTGYRPPPTAQANLSRKPTLPKANAAANGSAKDFSPSVMTGTTAASSAAPSITPSASSLIERLCIQCNKSESAEDSCFCGSECVLAAREGAPKIVPLPPAHYMFRRIQDRFSSQWLHPTSKPILQYIYMIVSTEDSDRMYRAYRSGVEAVGNFVEQGLKEGNEQYRWHGAPRECKVGDPGNKTLCDSTSCPLCCIIKKSYDVDKFGPRWGRFGKGIYTSDTSSKSNDYAKNLKESEWSALLLNNVIVGRAFSTKTNKDTLLQPPPNCDSVLGVPGEDLNYDETVVYRNDAIRPAFLVVYLSPVVPVESF